MKLVPLGGDQEFFSWHAFPFPTALAKILSQGSGAGHGTMADFSVSDTLTLEAGCKVGERVAAAWGTSGLPLLAYNHCVLSQSKDDQGTVPNVKSPFHRWGQGQGRERPSLDYACLEFSLSTR